MSIGLETLSKFILSNLKSLDNFEFTFFNPIFWVIIIILFYVLRIFWGDKNSFIFSSLVALILLFTTEFEGRIVAAFSCVGEPFDPVIIRLIALAIIAILVLAYVFLR